MQPGMKVNNKRTVKRGKPDYVILTCSILLFIIGIFFVLSASWPELVYKSKPGQAASGYSMAMTQLFYGIIGIFGMTFFMLLDYKIFKKSYVIFLIFIIAMIMGLAVFIPGIGESRLGATRWIRIGSKTFMPSDVMKLATIFFLAKFLENKENVKKNLFKTLIVGLIISSIPLIIIMFQNDMGTMLVLCAVIMIMFFSSGIPFRNLLAVAIPVVIVGVYKFIHLLNGDSFRGGRIRAWLDPMQYYKSEGWQPMHSLMALGTGGLTGLGLGRSRQKLGYIPFPYNDYIFSIIGEEAGLVGTTLVLLLYAVIILRGLRIAQRVDNLFGKYLAIGISSLLGVQAFVNIAVATVSIPSTGITLPFISYGGTSLAVIFFSIGFLLSVSREA